MNLGTSKRQTLSRTEFSESTKHRQGLEVETSNFRFEMYDYYSVQCPNEAKICIYKKKKKNSQKFNGSSENKNVV